MLRTVSKVLQIASGASVGVLVQDCPVASHNSDGGGQSQNNLIFGFTISRAGSVSSHWNSHSFCQRYTYMCFHVYVFANLLTQASKTCLTPMPFNANMRRWPVIMRERAYLVFIHSV